MHATARRPAPVVTTPEPVARVLILCNSPDNGGGANLLFRVTQHLDPRRVQATLFLHRDGWQAAQQRAHGHADVVVDPDFGEMDPVPRPRRGNLGAVARAAVVTTRNWGRAIAHVTRLITERRIDVVAGFGGTPATLATAAATIAGRPVVWSAQRCYDDLRAAIPMQALCLLPAVRCIFAVSRAAAAPYGHVPGKVLLAYNGIDPREVDPARVRGTLRTRLGLAEDVPLVGMAGRVIHLKGVDLFLKAAARIAGQHPEAHFVVIGRREGDAFDATLDGLAAAPGLAGRVHFTGGVEDMRPAMRDLDVLAIPSRRDAAPLVAYEGMGLARAIVATRCPGLDEQLDEGRTGLYVPREDVAALAAGIGRLLGDAALRRRLGAAARADVIARFDIRHMVGLVEETIVRLGRDPGARLGR
jgi:glycosyltransferase involved in cell wall biosynthesis